MIASKEGYPHNLQLAVVFAKDLHEMDIMNDCHLPKTKVIHEMEFGRE